MLAPDDIYSSAVSALASGSPYTNVPFAADGVVMATGSFDGVFFSKWGADNSRWMPLTTGRRFTVASGQPIWLKQSGSVVGTVTLEFYASTRLLNEEQLLEHLGRVAPTPPGKVQLVTGWNVIIQAVAAADVSQGPVALSANNVGSLVTNRTAGTIYIGPTAAKATAALGVAIPVQQAVKIPPGSIYWSGDGANATTMEVLEDLSS